MKDVTRRTFAPLVLVIIVLGALLVLAVWPRANLDGVDVLIASKQFDEAEGRLIRYLRRFPGDEIAVLLLARTSLDRTDPKPDLALNVLATTKSSSPRMAAEFKSIEGKAYFLKNRFDVAEASWLEALGRDPRVSDVGWGLLDLYALQGRDQVARTLGLRLFGVEPDPHDRIQILLQLIRHDAHAISDGSVVEQLGPVVRDNPGDFRSAVALGLALVRESRQDEGLTLLRDAAEAHKDLPELWDAYLTGLLDAGRIEDLNSTVDMVPTAMADDPRFEVYRGWQAARVKDWPRALAAYRKAWEARPSDSALAYRLLSTLRAAGLEEESNALSTRLGKPETAREKLREYYDQIDALPDLGRIPYTDLYVGLADLLEQLGRRGESQAWRKVAGRSEPAPRP